MAQLRFPELFNLGFARGNVLVQSGQLRRTSAFEFRALRGLRRGMRGARVEQRRERDEDHERRLADRERPVDRGAQGVADYTVLA